MFQRLTLKIKKVRDNIKGQSYNDSFHEVLKKDTSPSTHHQNLQFLEIKLYNVIKGLSPSLVKEAFPQNSPPKNNTK